MKIIGKNGGKRTVSSNKNGFLCLFGGMRIRFYLELLFYIDSDKLYFLSFLQRKGSVTTLQQ